MSRASHYLAAQCPQNLLGDEVVLSAAQLVHHHRQGRRVVRGQGAQPVLGSSSHAQRLVDGDAALLQNLLEGLPEKQIRLDDPAQHDAWLAAKENAARDSYAGLTFACVAGLHDRCGWPLACGGHPAGQDQVG